MREHLRGIVIRMVAPDSPNGVRSAGAGRRAGQGHSVARFNSTPPARIGEEQPQTYALAMMRYRVVARNRADVTWPIRQSATKAPTINVRTGVLRRLELRLQRSRCHVSSGPNTSTVS